MSRPPGRPKSGVCHVHGWHFVAATYVSPCALTPMRFCAFLGGRGGGTTGESPKPRILKPQKTRDDCIDTLAFLHFSLLSFITPTAQLQHSYSPATVRLKPCLLSLFFLHYPHKCTATDPDFLPFFPPPSLTLHTHSIRPRLPSPFRLHFPFMHIAIGRLPSLSLPSSRPPHTSRYSLFLP